MADVDHRFVSVTPDNKVSMLVELLEEDDRGLALLFVRTKAGALDRLVEGFGVTTSTRFPFTATRARRSARRALERFDSGKVKILVATDVAARDLDVDDITHVINFDPPEEPDVYTHRVGRTGRAGKGGIGITLVLAGAAGRRLARRAPAGAGRGVRSLELAAGEAKARLHIPARRRSVQVVDGERLTEKQAEALRERIAELEGPAPERRSSPRSRPRASSEICRRTSSTTPRRTSRGSSKRASARSVLVSKRQRSSRAPAPVWSGIGSVVDIDGDGGRGRSASRSVRSAAAGTVSLQLAARLGAARQEDRRQRRRARPEGRLARDHLAHPLTAVALSAYRPEWADELEDVARLLRSALGDLAVRVDHIGSTAVRGVVAKDIVDVQVDRRGACDSQANRRCPRGRRLLDTQADPLTRRDHIPAGVELAPTRPGTSCSSSRASGAP